MGVYEPSASDKLPFHEPRRSDSRARPRVSARAARDPGLGAVERFCVERANARTPFPCSGAKAAF
jgi:hypothetical protein